MLVALLPVPERRFQVHWIAPPNRMPWQSVRPEVVDQQMQVRVYAPLRLPKAVLNTQAATDRKPE